MGIIKIRKNDKISKGTMIMKKQPKIFLKNYESFELIRPIVRN